MRIEDHISIHLKSLLGFVDHCGLECLVHGLYYFIFLGSHPYIVVGRAPLAWQPSGAIRRLVNEEEEQVLRSLLHFCQTYSIRRPKYVHFNAVKYCLDFIHLYSLFVGLPQPSVLIIPPMQPCTSFEPYCFPCNGLYHLLLIALGSLPDYLTSLPL